MVGVIPSIFAKRDRIFASPQNRFFTVFKPIQRVDYKQSDFTAYLLNPIIDLCLAPAFLLDVVIDVVNTVISLLKAANYWSHNQQRESSLLDSEAKRELKEAQICFLNAISALMSAVINPILSILSLVTRPIASVVKCVADAIDECCSPSHGL
ncbi:hypothetical protein [Legionella cardiaca]|uniref:Uncharacterized protein n=1 Tax=Legionella cardiaca TaxID=1071983 RepID=A0ABY8AMB4_9GAMM|nr:hypothetical protein [Legionella cardiaca]WED41777.1 hypothetical protein PXX05_07470 [Legionella cardiaca]